MGVMFFFVYDLNRVFFYQMTSVESGKDNASPWRADDRFNDAPF